MNAEAVLAERASQIIKEERASYCKEVLGWDDKRTDEFLREPALWVKTAVERALSEGLK